MRLVVVLFLAVTSGCTTTATIVTTQRTLEARLEKGDAEHLPVVTEWGHREVLLRRDIRDVDHPGNVLAVVGGILTAMGVIDLSTFGPMCVRGTFGAGGVCATAAGMAIAGAPMFVWGLWTWLRSREAAEPPEDGVAVPLAAPAPCPDSPPRSDGPVVVPPPPPVPPVPPVPPDAPLSAPPPPAP
jgi:hypothetical protein